jgi:hypothetical protein
MPEGPAQTHRPTRRFRRVEITLEILLAAGWIVYLAASGYDLLLGGRWLELFAIAAVGAGLMGFAVWSPSVLGVVPMLLFVLALLIWG